MSRLLVSFVVIAATTGSAAAEAPGAAPSSPPVAAEPPSMQLALGSSLGWQARRDFGAATRAAFSPELLGAVYLPIGRPRVFLRPMLRVGFTGLDQSEQPDAIKIEERDVLGSVEVAVVYDGPVIPSLALGGGALVRFVDLDVDAPLESSGDPISRTEVLGRGFVQLGVGLPLRRGLVVLEPSVRYELVFGDDRIAWRGGIDVTVAL